MEAIVQNPLALLAAKVALAIALSMAVPFAVVAVTTVVTRELARWLWGWMGTVLMVAGPWVAVFAGGWWWLLVPGGVVISALYATVEYRDEGVPTSWGEVQRSYRARADSADGVR